MFNNYFTANLVTEESVNDRILKINKDLIELLSWVVFLFWNTVNIWY